MWGENPPRDLGESRPGSGGVTSIDFQVIMTDKNNWNRRREAAESAADLHEVMVKILGAPGERDDETIEAKKHAAAGLEGIDHVEKALRLWRDGEEDAFKLLDEVGHEDDEEMGNDEETPRERLADLNLEHRGDPETTAREWLVTAVTGLDMLAEGMDDPFLTEARAALVRHCIDRAIDALDGGHVDLAEIHAKYNAQNWAMDDER